MHEFIIEVQNIYDNKRADRRAVERPVFEESILMYPENSVKSGSAIVIKENLHHREETKFEAEDIQATVVDVKTKNYDSHWPILFA